MEPAASATSARGGLRSGENRLTNRRPYRTPAPCVGPLGRNQALQRSAAPLPLSLTLSFARYTCSDFSRQGSFSTTRCAVRLLLAVRDCTARPPSRGPRTECAGDCSPPARPPRSCRWRSPPRRGPSVRWGVRAVASVIGCRDDRRCVRVAPPDSVGAPYDMPNPPPGNARRLWVRPKVVTDANPRWGANPTHPCGLARMRARADAGTVGR
jgi:hypothetical protein